MHQIEFHIGHRDHAHVGYYHKQRLKVVLLRSIPAVFCWRHPRRPRADSGGEGKSKQAGKYGTREK